MDFLPMAGIALKNLFSKPATRLYPKVARPPFAANRGHIEIDFSQCILCGMCMHRCPAHAIAVDRAKGDWRIDRLSCVICGGCVSVCPKKCLALKPERSPVAAAAQKAGSTESHHREPAAPVVAAAAVPAAPKTSIKGDASDA